MIAGLRLRQERRPGDIELLRDVIEGVRFVIRHRGLRSVAYGVIVSMFGGGVLFAVGIGYIRQTLGGTDSSFGWLAALWGVGMGIGLLLVRVLVRERGRAPTFLAGVTLCGGVLIFMALVPVLGLAFLAAVIFGVAFSVAIVLALSLAQEAAEDRVRGRIMGGVQMLFRVGLGAGALGIGALAHSIDHVKVIEVFDGNQVGLLAGGCLILLGALAASGVARQGRWAEEANRMKEARRK
jgi:MFS family permease